MKWAGVLVASSCVLSVLAAQPRGALPSAAKHARATLLPVSVTATRATLLVTLAVDDGWHVSWRNPGETGLPTRFTWNLPAGVRLRRERWPVPVVTHTDVGVTHTLEGEVPWLVEFDLDTPAASDRLVSVTVRYGICRDVCIPEQQVVQGVLPGSGAGATAVVKVPELLRRRLAADAAAVPARMQAAGVLCLARLPPGVVRAGLEMIADSGRAVDGALPVEPGRGAAAGTARVRLPSSARLRSSVDTVLLVSGATGISLPLDFTRPATRCRAR